MLPSRRTAAAAALVGLLLIVCAGCRFGDPRTEQGYAEFESFGPPTVADVALPGGGSITASSSPREVALAAVRAMQDDLDAVAARNAAGINAARKRLYALSHPLLGESKTYRLPTNADLEDLDPAELAVRQANRTWGKAVAYYLPTASLDEALVVPVRQVPPRAMTYRVFVPATRESAPAAVDPSAWVRVVLERAEPGDASSPLRVMRVDLTEPSESEIAIGRAQPGP